MTSYIIGLNHSFIAELAGKRCMTIDHWNFALDDGFATAHIRSPDKPASAPSMLIYLTMTGRQGLELPPYSAPADLAVQHGHFVAGFDLPNHGERINSFGEGLDGMAAAIADGHHVFEETIAIGRSLIDRWTSNKVSSGAIVVAGVSRGALAAYHLVAAEPRVSAMAAFAPVTNLTVLREFSALPPSDALAAANASALVSRLRDRDHFICINEQDDRVGTLDCVSFFEALSNPVGPGGKNRLRIDPGATHTVSDAAYREGSVWILRHLDGLPD